MKEPDVTEEPRRWTRSCRPSRSTFDLIWLDRNLVRRAGECEAELRQSVPGTAPSIRTESGPNRAAPGRQDRDRQQRRDHGALPVEPDLGPSGR